MAADPAFAKQIGSVIEEAGLVADEQTKADCMWLVGRDIPLTAEHLLLLQDMNRMEQGNEAAVTEKIVEALKEGKAPKEALLAGESLLEKQKRSWMRLLLSVMKLLIRLFLRDRSVISGIWQSTERSGDEERSFRFIR